MVAYGSEGDGGSSKADETAVAGMRLMDSIGVVVAKLFENVVYALEILGGYEIADDPLEPCSVAMSARLISATPSLTVGAATMEVET